MLTVIKVLTILNRLSTRSHGNKGGSLIYIGNDISFVKWRSTREACFSGLG